MNVESKRIDRSLYGWLVGSASFWRTTLGDWKKYRIPFMHTRVCFAPEPVGTQFFCAFRSRFFRSIFLFYTLEIACAAHAFYAVWDVTFVIAQQCFGVCNGWGVSHLPQIPSINFVSLAADLLTALFRIRFLQSKRYRRVGGDGFWWCRKAIAFKCYVHAFIDEIWRGYTWWVCTRVPRRQANTITRNAPTFGKAKINKTKRRRRRRMCYAICNR